MKKLIITLGLLLGLNATMLAADTCSNDESILPQQARTLISDNFQSKISVIEVEKKKGNINEYEVVLSDGTEIIFDENGNMESIETPRAESVPSVFIPQKISDYIAKNYSSARVVGIDKESYGYEIDLSNGIGLQFNVQGDFIRFDM